MVFDAGTVTLAKGVRAAAMLVQLLEMLHNTFPHLVLYNWPPAESVSGMANNGLGRSDAISHCPNVGAVNSAIVNMILAHS